MVKPDGVHRCVLCVVHLVQLNARRVVQCCGWVTLECTPLRQAQLTLHCVQDDAHICGHICALCCRGLVAEILGRFERKGYKLVGIKVLVPTQVCMRTGVQHTRGSERLWAAMQAATGRAAPRRAGGVNADAKCLQAPCGAS